MQKHWVQSWIGILGIAFAIVCLVPSLYWMKYETSYDGFYPDADHIYRVYTFDKQSGKVNKGSSKVVENKLRGQYAGIEASTTLMRGEENCRTETVAHVGLRFLYADNSFFTVFPQEFVAGDKVAPLAVMNNLVLTETKAIQLFGSAEKAIGQSVQSKMRDDLPPYLVTGVVKDSPACTNLPFDGLVYHNMLKSFASMPEEMQWSMLVMDVYVRFNSNAAVREIVEQARASSAHIQAASNLEIRMMPITDVRHELEANSPFTVHFIRLFVVLGALLLIAAVFNFFNLSFDLFRQRMHELNLRSVNGATVGQMMFQLLFELMSAVVLSVVLAAGFIVAISPSFSEWLDIRIQPYHLGWLFIICSVLLICVIAGIGALLFGRLIRSAVSPQPERTVYLPLYKRIAVTLQLFVSIVFVVVTLIVMRQMHYVAEKDLGLESEGLVQLSGFVDYSGKIQTKLVHEILSIPQVKGVSDAGFSPSHDVDPQYERNDIYWEGAPTEPPLFNMLLADSHFSEVLRLTMLDGRWWNEGESDKVVLNTEAVRRMNLARPVGTVIRMPSMTDLSVVKEYVVVGVVKDFHVLSFRNPIHPMLFIPSPYFFNTLYIRVEKGQELLAIQRISQMLTTIDPSLSDVKLTPVEALYMRLNSAEQVGLKIFSILAIVCLLISLFGVYAIALASTQRRRKEIAIRKVAGAEAKDIVGLFSKEYVLQVLFAALFALPVAYMSMRHWLQDYAYRTNIPLGILLGVVAGILAFVIFTILGQIMQAAHRNPAEEIRRG